MSMRLSLITLAVGTLGTFACSRPVPPPPTDTPRAELPVMRMGELELGRHVGPDNRISDSTSVFAPRDTFYLSVPTEYTTSTTALVAKWTFLQTGQLVDSTAQPIAAPTGADPVTFTEFHVAKRGGWPVGKYKVDVTLSGQLKRTLEFEVRR